MKSKIKQLKRDYWTYRDIALTAAARNGEPGKVLNTWKYFPRWRKSMHLTGSSVKDRQPWMLFEAIDLLKNFVKPGFKVFEYGAGGSTLFFLDCGAEVSSVEHDEKWYGELQNIITDKNRWKGMLLKPEKSQIPESADPTDPASFISSSAEFKNMSFEKYARAIDSYPDHYFDLVVVDGRARPSCLKQSMQKVRKGGWLLLDNSERPVYFPSIDLLKNDFTEVFNRNGAAAYCTWVSKTGIWQKK